MGMLKSLGMDLVVSVRVPVTTCQTAGVSVDRESSAN